LSYFNVHTHRKPQNKNEFCIRNAYLNSALKLPLNYYVCAGLHPWFVHRYSKEELLHKLQIILSEPSVLAVGEIGLDKLRPHFELQKKYFEWQLALANEHQKPAIIHLVKASQELRTYLNKNNNDLVLHGFTGGLELWKQLNPQGKTHVSIGQQVFKASKNLIGLIQQIPIEFLFTETDQSTVSIVTIYQEIAKIRGVSMEELETQLGLNFKRVFLKD
jgi:TatD DNase family protein